MQESADAEMNNATNELMTFIVNLTSEVRVLECETNAMTINFTNVGI